MTRKEDAGNLASNVRKLFKPSQATPAEEAASYGSVSVAAAAATASYSDRWQNRLRLAQRWLKALQDVASYAEQAFGQAAEEAIVEAVDQGSKIAEPVYSEVVRLGPDFTTDSEGETEKIADTEPVPPMNREQRRAAAAAGKPVGPKMHNPAEPPPPMDYEQRRATYANKDPKGDKH